MDRRIPDNLLERAARAAACGDARSDSRDGGGGGTPLESLADLARAKKEYTMLAAMAEEAASAIDTDAVRTRIRRRIDEEHRNVIGWMMLVPMLVGVCAFVSWLGLSESTLMHAGRAAAIGSVLAASMCLAIWCWWWWYRTRALRAFNGSADTLRGWLRSDGRSQRREAKLNELCWSIVLLALSISAIAALADGAWVRGVLFGIPVLVILAAAARRTSKRH